MREAGRQPAHARNPELEALLAALARDLAAGSDHPPGADTGPRHPPLFLVGCARSGTTLALQWLAAGGAFTYPTNLVARFPTAPWVGEKVVRLLTDPACDHRGELLEGLDPDPVPWWSSLGKTRGLLAPHEFWYWWRRFLPDAPVADPAADRARMRRELAAWEAVRDRPLLMKALIADWCLPWLAATFPRALFLHVTREPVAVMRSLLAVRRDFYGDEAQWYSFATPRSAAQRGLPPEVQVAAQVHDTVQAVRDGLTQVPPARHRELRYEDLCADPAGVHARLAEWLGEHGVAPWERRGPDRFPDANAALADDPRAPALRRAWDEALAPSAS